MSVSERLKTFLASSKVRYSTMKHQVVYTAQEIAAAQHVPGRQMAKCVLILTDRGAVLAVLPAVHLVDLKKLKSLLRSTKVSIGKESDIRQHFPDVEVGAMSPFGNLYDVPVVMDRSLQEAGQIVFNGGTHNETVKMGGADVARLAKAKLGSFGIFPRGSAERKGAKKKAGAKKKPTKKVTKKKTAKKNAKGRGKKK